MKRIISLVLAVIVMCGIFTGCGGTATTDYEDDGSAVTLKIAIPWSEQEDIQKVTDAINTELETLLPNTKIELMCDSSMADKWSLWMSTQKVIDIAHSGYITEIENEVRNESYLGLNDMIKNYAPNIQKLSKKYWYSYDNATIKDELYAIPNIQYYIKETTVLRMDDSLTSYIDTQAMINALWSSDKTTEEFYKIMDAGVAKAAAAGVNVSSTFGITMLDMAKRGYNFISDSNLCYDNSDDVKIIDFYTTPEFEMLCKYMKQWGDKSWISKDILTSSATSGSLIYISDGFRYKMDETTGVIPSATGKHFSIDNPELDVVRTNIGQNKTYWSIPYTAKNPVRAIKFLDIINSEEGKAVTNLLAYGIEGEHWEFTDKENGDIKAFEYEGQGTSSVSYGIPNWMVCNMMVGMYNVYPYTHENKEYGEHYYSEFLNSHKKHVLYGFTFDIDEIKTEISNINKNNSEKESIIFCGVIAGGETTKEELLSKNKTAGIEKVIENLQKQADKYIASEN